MLVSWTTLLSYKPLFFPVGHKLAHWGENHTWKGKDINLIPVSGVSLVHSCKLKPQLQRVTVGLC